MSRSSTDDEENKFAERGAFRIFRGSFAVSPSPNCVHVHGTCHFVNNLIVSLCYNWKKAKTPVFSMFMKQVVKQRLSSISGLIFHLFKYWLLCRFCTCSSSSTSTIPLKIISPMKKYECRDCSGFFGFVYTQAQVGLINPSHRNALDGLLHILIRRRLVNVN